MAESTAVQRHETCHDISSVPSFSFFPVPTPADAINQHSPDIRHPIPNVVTPHPHTTPSPSTLYPIYFRHTTNPACTALLTLLPPDTILTPNTPGSEYTNATLNAWNAFNRPPFYTPGCIVLPTTASHVQIAMRTIFQFGVAYNVQSGGHSAMKGWNTVDEDGVLVLFTNMRKVVYNEEKGSITLEPGVTWGEAVGQMAQFGVTPVGGRISDVGTALLLGGGLSFLSPRHGFASDTYISLDVVLVDGTLVTATQDNEYKDLFWALKGGGSRFGIVVKYELKAVQTHDNDGDDDETWYGGVLTFDPSNETIHTFLRAVVAVYTRKHRPRRCYNALHRRNRLPILFP
ncbi:hypothetical protein VNI00_000198 [Paramarasmius palmivorus]|uniref:FAD-binding PCMH-type domain-containing protein n=1 Tax=Paramarasmius palmivorus TaxID=297713 RepID=A0AAW0EET1_9AGAR